METKNDCAYNVTRNALLSERVAMADGSLGSMKILDLMMHGPRADRSSAVWLKGCSGSPNVPRLFAFDVLYMDADCRVLEAARVSPETTFPTVTGGMTGALILPDGMLASTGTAAGDLLRMCDDAELAALVKAGSESTVEQREAAMPVGEAATPLKAAGNETQASMSFEVVRTAGYAFEPFSGSLIHLGEVRRQGAQSTEFFLPGGSIQAETAHVFTEVPMAQDVSSETAKQTDRKLAPQESAGDAPVPSNGEIKWGEPKKKSRKAAREEELRFFRPQPIKFFDPLAESEDEAEAGSQAPQEGRPSSQLSPELKAAILQIDEQHRQKKEKEEQQKKAEASEQQKSRFQKTKPAKQLEDRQIRERDREPEETKAKTATRWERFAIPQPAARDQAEAVQAPAQSEPLVPVQELSAEPVATPPMPMTEPPAATSSLAEQAAAPLAEHPPRILETPLIKLPLFESIGDEESVTTAPANEVAQASEPEPQVAAAASVAPEVSVFIPAQEETIALATEVVKAAEPEPRVAAAVASVAPEVPALITAQEETIAPATEVAQAAEPEPQVAVAAASVAPEEPVLIPAQEETIAPTTEVVKAAEPEPQVAVAAASVAPEEPVLIPAQEETIAPTTEVATEVARVAEQNRILRPRRRVRRPKVSVSIPAKEQAVAAPKEVTKVAEPEPQVAAAAASVAAERSVPRPVREPVIAAQARGVEEGRNSAKVESPRTASIAQPVKKRAPVAKEQVETGEDLQKKKEKIPLKARLQHWFEEEKVEVVPDPNTRRAERMSLPGLVAFYFSGGTPRPHEIVNISRTGLYLKTTDLWSVETMVRMTLQRQVKDQPKKQESLSVLTRVVRIDEGGWAAHEFVTMEALMAKRGRDVMPDQGTDCRALDKFLHVGEGGDEGMIIKADPNDRRIPTTED